jgi:ABC-type uncharacterized transport system substrate-binding protein
MTGTNVKGLEILNAAVPKAKRIAVLWNPDVPSHTPSLKALDEAARRLHLHLETVVARTAADLESAFAAMARAHAQAVFVLGWGPYISARQQMAALAMRHACRPSSS